MRYIVSLGCTVNAYARVTVEADSKTELVAKLRDLIAAKAGDQSFEIEWGTADDYRVIGAEDADKREALTPEALQAISDGE